MTPIPALPEADWMFDEDAMDARELNACYWWEYCRSSVAVRSAVRDMTTAEGWERGFKRAAASVVTFGAINFLRSINKRFGAEVFPATSWKVFKNMKVGVMVGASNGKRGDPDGAQLAGFQWMSLLETLPPPPIKISEAGIGVRSGQIHASAQEVEDDSTGYIVTLPILGGAARGQVDARTSRLLTIDWSFSNQEIEEAFRAYLETPAGRPAEFPNPRRGMRVAPNGSKEEESQKAALGWLSIWRRKQVCSWSRFESLYPGESSERAELRRKCRKAEAILRRFGD